MKKTLPAICLLVATIACMPKLYAQTHPPIGADKTMGNKIDPFQKGVVLIKFTKSYESLLASRSADATNFGINKLDSLLQTLKVKATKQEFAILFNPDFNRQSAINANRALAAKMQPLVTAELLDQRHREFGFHLWYRLQFDSTIYLKAVLSKLQSLKGIVEVAEPVQLIKPASFNDPLYPNQYSLQNTGQLGGTPGADIKAEQAWGITTGDSSVIIAITDEGIKMAHEDLDSSMWFGKGFNFLNNTGNIVVGDHGTHVAGVAAARSNNGKGISGIAGGNGTAASGARLMSCMIFGPGGSFVNPGAAFVYAADNGAAINNNSWGDYGPWYYREFSFMDAVRYFSKYGGGTSIKGGITVWAGSNDNITIPLTNATYDVENNINVAATDNMDKKASFSNYGDYIDISAPGVRVLSTVGDQSGSSTYSNYYGTSMSTPIVSGVMALVASVAPGRFTADEVSGIVLSTADNIDSLNPGYERKLGSGRVNAYRAVLKAKQIAALPLLDTVRNTVVSRTCNGYNVSYIKNAANNDVMIALGLSHKFDMPNGRVYNVGDSIGKGAKVVYKGAASSFAITRILKDSALHYIKIWSINGSNYSGGTVLHADSSFHTLRNPSATQGANSIDIQFGKVCPNSDIMVVVNSLPQFGKPSGVLNTGNTVAGGGTILYKGSAAGFTHSGLSSGTYYYALYPVIGNVYGMPKYLGGYCLSTTGIPLPLKTSFESPGVPQNFAIFTPSQREFGWSVKQTGGGSTGHGYAYTNNAYNYLPEGINEESYIQTASLNVTAADSIICRFAHAFGIYDSTDLDYYGADYHNYLDTLTLLISTDCGQTWQTGWKKWGYDLKTMDIYNSTIPISPNDWAQNKINLTDLIPTGTSSIMVAFKNTNRGWSDIFLDDINIYKVKATDAGISSIIYPDDVCASPFIPKVALTNFGSNPLTSATIFYSIDGGPFQSVTWTGNKLYEQTEIVTLPTVTAAIGNHTLTVYTSLPNGVADDIPANDTLTSGFRVLQPIALAANTTYTESFESPAFPPDQWRVAKPTKYFSWEKDPIEFLPGFVAAVGTNSAFVNTYSNPVIGDTLDMFSPIYNTGNADTVRLMFSRAASDYLGTGATTDKLEVFLTKDCGETFIPIYSKTGAALTTTPVAFRFFYPTSLSEWRKDTVDISSLVRNAGTYRFLFRVTNDNNNNVLLDDVQLQSKQAGVVLPLNLHSFTGKAVGTNRAQLAWRTANEINTSYFELQRSTDGRNFTPILLMHAKGNAQSTTDYGFTDGYLQPNQYYYRLRIEDRDGKQTYSQVVSVVLRNNNDFTIYPVPAKDAIFVNSSNVAMVGKNLQLTDIQGRVLQTFRINQLPQQIDVSALATGTYLLKLPDETTVKFIKK